MSSRQGALLIVGVMVAAFVAILLLGGERQRQVRMEQVEPPAPDFADNARTNALHDVQRSLVATPAPNPGDPAPVTTLTVQVLDAGQGGVSGAEFFVTSYPDMSRRNYRCDEGGRATLQFRPPVDLTFVYVSRTMGNSGYHPVRAVHGAGSFEVILQPAPMGVVTGKVVLGGEAVPDLPVTLWHEAQLPQEAATDASGWYRFEGVSPGRLFVRLGQPMRSAPKFHSLSPAETVVLDFNLPNQPLVMVLQDPATGTAHAGAKLEIEFESAETRQRSVLGAVTDESGNTGELLLAAGTVRWRVREGGASRLPGYSGEFEWEPGSMAREVLLTLRAEFRVVELLMDPADSAAFELEPTHGRTRIPQLFLLMKEGSGAWMHLNAAPPRTPGQRAVLVPSQHSGTVAWLDRKGETLAQGELHPEEATVRVVRMPVVRLLAFVERAEGMLAVNFKCVRIVDEKGQEWPTSAVWLNHFTRQSIEGEWVVPAEIAQLPPGTYQVEVSDLFGRRSTQRVVLDGATPTQTIRFSLQ